MTHAGSGEPAARSATRRRGLLAGGVAVAVLLLAGFVWILVTGWQARSALLAMRHDIRQLRSDLIAGRSSAAEHDLAEVQSKAAHAVDRTSGPAWWVGAHLPLLGEPLRTTRTIASIGHSLSHTAMPLVLDGGQALSPKSLRTASDQIDLADLQQGGPLLARALPSLDAARERISRTSSSWLGPVSSGRSSVLRELTSLDGTLRDTVLATRLLPPMLGESGPRRYLVVFEGDNEARALGGIFGGYGLLSADHGRMTFGRFGSDRDFHGITADVDLGPQFAKAYGGDDAYHSIQDADISPHFPDAAQIWASMVSQRLGLHIDGVLAVDPVMLSRILTVIGPVRMADGTRLTGHNLVRLLDVGVYQRFDAGEEDIDTPARKAFFVAAGQAVTQAVLERNLSTTKLLHALASSAGQRRLVAYSAHPDEEAILAGTPLGGVLHRTSEPFEEAVVTNDSGTKLDYFLHRTLVYRRSSCAADTATVSLTLHNAAPSSGLPAYMTTGVQWGSDPHPPGSEFLIVSLYSTEGASVSGVTLDGKPIGTYSAVDRGHPITETILTILPGQTLTEQFTVHEPAATGPVVLPQQPLAQPMTVRDDSPACT